MWLSAAADERVAGIIPIALDTLIAPAQIPHHRKAFGGWSASARAFEETIKGLETPRGRRLIRMLDPYTYRTEIEQPKLIVLGTNDDYYPADSLNLYWKGLVGPKWILYLPNADHVGSDANPV